MNGVGAGDFRRSDDGGDVQVGFRRRRGTDADALVGQTHMHGVGVGGRMYGDGGDAHFLARAIDAQRDFPAIGDEDFVKHGE